MPLGLTLGRPFTPLSVATSARSSAIACRSAAFSASNRSARASSSPRDRPERGIFADADMPRTSRPQGTQVQPRKPTAARGFAPRTLLAGNILVSGDAKGVALILPLFEWLAPEDGVVRASAAGASHFALVVRAR